MDNIISLLTHALAVHGQQRTASSLGDRSTYIGMSDIAKAADCLRAAVAEKLRPALPKPASLTRELRLQRGHWFEQGIASAFTSTGQLFLHQVEIQFQHHEIPVKAHLDFVFVGQDEQGTVHVQVIECKSCENIPATAYASHEMQVYGQIGLLHSCWNTPCFSLPAAITGRKQSPTTFPALIKEAFDLTLPKTISQNAVTGHILCISMNDAQTFGPYSPNDLMLNACLGLGESIWKGIADIQSGQSTLNDLPTASGHHPLCDYCEENANCPRFDGIAVQDIEDDLRHLLRLKSEKDLICKNIQEEENRLKQLCRARLPQGGWLNAEANRVRLANCDGKRSLDKGLLYAELTRHVDADTALDIIESAHKVGNGYERLTIGNIHHQENALENYSEF